MSGPLVTGVIAVYNGERYLREAIESVLAQSYTPIELLVVDDGSTDGTASVTAQFGDRLRYAFQANAGQCVAMNRGLAAARGELIAFLDADDRWTPEKTARQVVHLEEHPATGAVFGHAQNFWIEELRAEAERFRDHRISKPLPGFVNGTMMARRTAFATVGLFDNTLRHGVVQDWVLRARERGVVVDLLPDLVLERRLHPGNQSRALREESRAEFLALVKRDLDRKRGR